MIDDVSISPSLDVTKATRLVTVRSLKVRRQKQWSASKTVEVIATGGKPHASISRCI